MGRKRAEMEERGFGGMEFMGRWEISILCGSLRRYLGIKIRGDRLGMIL